MHLTRSRPAQTRASPRSTQPAPSLTNHVLERTASPLSSSCMLERFQNAAQENHLQRVGTNKATLSNQVEFTGSLHLLTQQRPHPDTPNLSLLFWNSLGDFHMCPPTVHPACPHWPLGCQLLPGSISSLVHCQNIDVHCHQGFRAALHLPLYLSETPASYFCLQFLF